MPVTIAVAGDQPAAGRAIEEAFAEFSLLDRTFSPFLADSAVGRINRDELQVGDAGALVRQAAELCQHYERATGGYFSAWPGGRFDPTGLVKGMGDRQCLFDPVTASAITSSTPVATSRPGAGATPVSPGGWGSGTP